MDSLNSALPGQFHVPYCSNCGKEVAEEAAFCPHCGTPTRTTRASAPPPLPSTPIVESRYASVGARFVAVLIDTVIVAVVAALISIPFGIAALFLAPRMEDPLAWSPFGFLNTLLWMAYFSYFEAASGQTFGKQVVGIKVVDLDGISRVEISRALIRNILRIVDFLPFFYIIGVLLISTASRRQRLGDVFGRTIVVRA